MMCIFFSISVVPLFYIFTKIWIFPLFLSFIFSTFSLDMCVSLSYLLILHPFCEHSWSLARKFYVSWYFDLLRVFSRFAYPLLLSSLLLYRTTVTLLLKRSFNTMFHEYGCLSLFFSLLRFCETCHLSSFWRFHLFDLCFANWLSETHKISGLAR